MLDNDFPVKISVLLRPVSLAEAGGSDAFVRAFNPEQAMQNPKPFTVIQNGKPLFTVHAYSLDQAQAIVASKIAGEVIVVAFSWKGFTNRVETLRDGAGR